MPSDVVEVDGKHILTRKYHRGRVLVSQSVWVVGAICRRTKRVSLKIVRKKDAASLTKFVTENIAWNKTIITDMVQGYNDVKYNNFEHLEINQSINFVGPFNKEIHTNTIERAWRSLKEYMPTSLKASGYDEYVRSFLFNKELQKNAELDKFEFVLVMIGKFFHY
jgi:hypothetical protein